MPGIARLHQIESLYYGVKDGRINIGRTLGAVQDFAAILRRNGRKLASIVSGWRPDVAVTDSVYTFRPFKRSGVPLVALNNADVVHQGLSPLQGSTPFDSRAVLVRRGAGLHLPSGRSRSRHQPYARSAAARGRRRDRILRRQQILSFQSPQHKRALSEAWRFLVLLLASYALSLTLFSALTWSGIVPYLAKLATDTICFFFNFLVMRWWVYRRGELALRFVPQERAR